MKADRRPLLIVAIVMGVAVLGYVITLLPSAHQATVTELPTVGETMEQVAKEEEEKRQAEVEAAKEEVLTPEQQHIKDMTMAELDKRFQQAVAMLHAGQYEFAIRALHEVLAIAPKMPEAHTNMGFALLGLNDYSAAQDFFNVALNLNSMQVNAYYGSGLALYGMGDVAGAIGSMESYMHLFKPSGNDEVDKKYWTKANDYLNDWRKEQDETRLRLADRKREEKRQQALATAQESENESEGTKSSHDEGAEQVKQSTD